jgi:hypothetical protein
VAQAQTSQDFESWPTTASWGTSDHEGWRLSDGQVKTGRGSFAPPIGMRCGWLYDFDDSTNSWLQSPLFPTGIVSVSVWTRQDIFSGGSSSVVLEKNTNENEWTNVESFTIDSAGWTQRIFSVNTLDPTRLRIRKTGDDAANTYAGIDDIEVTIIGTTTSTTTDTSMTSTIALVLHYTFDVDEGGIVSDQSGNGHTGTVFGATWNSDGVIGGSCSFDGTDDYIDIPDADDLDASVISVSAWVDLAGPDLTMAIASKHSLPDDTGWIVFRFLDNDFRFSAGNGTWPSLNIETPNVYSQGWHHVVAVNSETEAKLYVDGQLAAQGSGTVISPNNKSIYLGRNRDNGVRYLDGRLDDIRLYCGVLAESDITNLYNAGSTTSTTSTSSTSSTTTFSTSTSTSSTSTTSTTSTSSTTSPLSSEYRVVFFYGGGYFSYEAGDIDPGLSFGHGFLAPGSGDGARFDFWFAEDGVVDGTGVAGGGGASIMDPNYAAGNDDLFLGSTVFNEDGVDQYQGGSGIDADSFAFDLPNGGILAEFTGQGIADGTAVGYGRVFETDIPQVGDWYYVGEAEVLRDTSDPRVPPNAIGIGRAMGIGGLDQIDATPF